MDEKAVSESEGITGENHYVRFPLSYRVQHVVLMLIFLTLIVTGLPLLFPDSGVLRAVFVFPAFFVLRGVIHRAAATALVLFCIFHVFFVIFSEQGNRDARRMAPGVDDIKKALGSVLFSFGIAKAPPEYGRFRFVEKFQYVAVAVAALVMIATGGVLWFEELSLMLFPKWAMDIAITIHGFEAILVFVTLIAWHVYTVHFAADSFPMSRVWLDGKISEEKMKKLHPLEYREIREGKAASAKR